MKPIISHIKQEETSGSWKIQTNAEHCKGVAELAKLFASKFNMGDWGYYMGLLHDKGKERYSFQQYIQKVSGYDPNANWHGEDKRHAYIGAQLLQDPSARYSIMGHHSGLDDYSDFNQKIRESIPPEVIISTYNSKLPFPKSLIESIKTNENLKKDYHHITRVLFSCLVDADFLNTEAFMQESNSRLRNKKSTLVDLYPLLDEYIARFQDAPQTDMNKFRNHIQKCCIEASEKTPGFYSLCVPTGGGKTVSSLLWAIKHAIKNHNDRIIIAIPYTSIVTQTANILSNIFGQENVLEHHSNTDFDQYSDETIRLKMRLATENWDYPIIVTTNVQLFESLFSNKPSMCRKIHNIVNSVIILDEVQTLPLKFLQPIVDTLKTFQRIFSTSILFTTASLPVLQGEIRWGVGPRNCFRGIDNIIEIATPRPDLDCNTKRVNLIFDETETTHEEIAARIAQHPRALCIVNSRKDAKIIYEHLPEGDLKFHLSRMMCSAHIRKVIDKIKVALTSDASTKIWVIATQLIEAGVDIDFPVVFRQEAGLDSILQAAGRCNREGLLQSSPTYVFRFKDKPYGSIRQDCYAREALAETSDWFASETMTQYFIQRYSRCNNFDVADVEYNLYQPNTDWNFKTVADNFKLVDDTGNTIYVSYGEEVKQLIDNIRLGGPTYNILKRLSQYSVSIHKRDFEQLHNVGIIEEVVEGCYYIPDRKQYDENIGLKTDSHWLEEILTV